MTVEEWKKRCAARYIERAGVTIGHAQELADACFENQDGEFSTAREYSPEDCADDDMSYWASDEG